MVVIAIVAALAVFGVVLVTVAETMQQAEARGCSPTSAAANASKGRCIQP